MERKTFVKCSSKLLATGVMFSTLKCVEPHAFCGRSTQDSEVNEHRSSKTLYTVLIHTTSGSLSSSGVFSFYLNNSKLI